MKLIGIAGPARSGKDTAAQFFIDTFRYAKLAFADPLKQGLRAMLGLTVDHTDGDLKECVLRPYGISPRSMMQTIGTEWGRDLVNDDIWLLRMGQRIDEIDAPGVVISDVRFENEAAWVRERGGLIIHLQRPEVQQVLAHASEAGVAGSSADLLALNDGTIEELHEQLENIVRFDNARQERRREKSRLSG